MPQLPRWDRYNIIDEKYDELGTSITDALDYHLHNQSSQIQARLWSKVTDLAREIAALSETEVLRGAYPAPEGEELISEETL
jgi:hypothetical protein